MICPTRGLVACLLLVSAGVALATPSVSIGLKAAFPAGPYLLELLETAAGENSSAYFPLLDRIAGGHFATISTDAELYASFIHVLYQDGHVTHPEALSTFDLALSLRLASPRIEAHHQYYSTAVKPVTPQSPGCKNWVLSGGKQFCTPTTGDSSRSELSLSQVKQLPFDRTLGAGRDVVLYADPTSASFASFHRPLSEAARQGTLRYRLRYLRDEADDALDPLPMSGYGVELALKRTDYIVIDDRATGLGSERKESTTEAIADGEDEELADIVALSKSELGTLGMRVASAILESKERFESLIKLTQDLPRLSAFISRHHVSVEFERESKENQAKALPPGINWLWVNGVQLIERQIEPITIVEILRRERRLVDAIRQLGFSGRQAIDILGHDEISKAKKDVTHLRYDWTDKSEGGNAIIWLNDLEKDSRYAQYPRDLASLLQPSYYGQIPPIARNLFNIVMPVDLADPSDLEAIAQMMQLLYRGFPIRFGLVPLILESPQSDTRAKVVHHLIDAYGLAAVAAYVGELIGSEQLTDEALFHGATQDQLPLPGFEAMSIVEVLDADTYKERLWQAQQWTARLGVGREARLILINGFVTPRDNNKWMQSMSMLLGRELQMVQQWLLNGTIHEDTSVQQLILKDVLTKRNPYIIPENDNDLRMMDIKGIRHQHAELFDQVPVLEAHEGSQKESWAVITIVADLTTREGQLLVLTALQFKKNNHGIRLDLVHNSELLKGASAVNAALTANKGRLAEIETLEELENHIKTGNQESEQQSYIRSLESFLQAANIPRGTQVIILNGRAVGPIDANSTFTIGDFQSLFEFERKTRILPVYAAIDRLGLSGTLSNPLAAAELSAIVALSSVPGLPDGIFESAPSDRTSVFNEWQSQHSAFEVGDKEAASIHIVGLLNPVSEQGQRWAPILKVLSELEGVYVKLFLNPNQNITELPVKRFYRYVLKSRPSFDEKGRVENLTALFDKLPWEAIMTAGMNVPPAWLVAPQESAYDLDNIKLSSVKSGVTATYELKNILVEGHSREATGAPPRGAQLVLATGSDPHRTDTIIMSNLGFFQFKANPGVYTIRLKEGRSSEMYHIESIGIGAQGWSQDDGEHDGELALMDFQGVTLYPRLRRRPGMEEEDVLDDVSKDQGEQQNIVSRGLQFGRRLFGGGGRTTDLQSTKEHADINIFSVASGHLYERMLNIMMVSVMRHTKHSVKFWFIEQFLSPSFKQFIPYLAEEYGFEFEMVSFKWPHWLRQQKEKQREIWGYKILFLDVLFPLSLDKVIFVDADQIVRTDMMDLVKLDLHGAPYAFTPMCDSRAEMEGFRFWKQGYWESYLRGRPYHISALYVVDLRRFRRLAAGDRLRQQYHALSADPGSLANLDQDLPNHMQFHIPIHSLPQEWLWCETWCSDESLSQARTIDLCNNPQTKEPKLDRARRQIPEWSVYDDEIAALNERWKREKDLVAHGKQGKIDEIQTNEDQGKVNTKSRKLEGAHTIDEL